MNHFQTIRKIDQLAYNKATKEKEILFLLILIFKIYLKKNKEKNNKHPFVTLVFSKGGNEARSIVRQLDNRRTTWKKHR